MSLNTKMVLSLAISSLFIQYFTTASDPDPVQDFCIPNANATIKSPHDHYLPCESTTRVRTEDFIFSGLRQPPQDFTDIGFSGLMVTPNAFPGLNTLGMSFARAALKKGGGINVPHFHPRATEIAYVVKGKVYMGFVDSTNRVFAKVIEAGEVMVYPRGLLHFQMNVGEEDAVVIGCFNSQNPGIQRIPNAIFGSGINDKLLEKVFGLSARQVGSIRRKFLPKKLG